MKNLVIYFVLIATSTVNATWFSKAKLKNAEKYFTDLIQETVYEMERRDWSTFKLLDINQTLNEQMYNWLVAGTVTYTNGFLDSIQSIELRDVEHFLMNAANPVGVISGTLTFLDVGLGYDVITNLTNEGVQYFTGLYVHKVVEFKCSVSKNYNRNTVTADVMMLRLTDEEKMDYMPAKNLTEVLSRNYRGFLARDGVAGWINEVIRPILTELVETKFPFPEICFNQCKQIKLMKIN